MKHGTNRHPWYCPAILGPILFFKLVYSNKNSDEDGSHNQKSIFGPGFLARSAMIQFEHVSKSFPGVAALSDVTFKVQAGECHALLGENGAGKSTLGKILAGMYRPDGGRILIDGQAVTFHSCRDAARAGVAIVHQELVFCPNLSVAENLCLHDLPRRGLLLDRHRLRRQAAELLAQIGLDVDVDRPLSSLSIAQEQLVQIAAAVGLGAKIVVFDEPTSSLGRDEVDRLFALIRRLRQSGVTIIYVSHRLEEIFELCQIVTVLRDGRRIGTRPIGEIDHDELVRMMVGRGVETTSPAPKTSASSTIRLRVRRSSPRGGFTDLSLDLRSCEIVGLAGLVGAGRTEVLEALFGLDRYAAGELVIERKASSGGSSRKSERLRDTVIPGDRQWRAPLVGMEERQIQTY